MILVFNRSEIEQQLEAFETTLKDLEDYREVLQQTTVLFANDTVRTIRGVVRAYFNEVHLIVVYNPTKNVKLLSKDSKHEWIYNIELGKFVDVEPLKVFRNTQ